MKRIFVTILALVALATSGAQAQYSGLLANRSDMTVGDMANISQTQFQYGTARSMAIAGAMTSLGGDATSMAINPAGIGMYNGNEFTITPNLSIHSAKNSAPVSYGENSNTNFGLSNVAAVVNLHNAKSNSGLVSVNFGFGYTKLADLNYNYSFQSQSVGSSSSIGQFFADQLNSEELSLSTVSASNNWSNIPATAWGAALGYQVGWTDYYSGGDGDSWGVGWIDSGATVDHFTTIESRGYVGEYDMSLGMNFGNKLYVGATVSLMDFSQKIYYDYAEEFPDKNNADYAMNYAYYNQAVVLSGSGVNFKLGVTYRPTPELRIGMAVHTPTYYTVDREYQAAASSSVYVSTSTPASGINPDNSGNAYFSEETEILADYAEYGWEFTSPTRLMWGVSYIIAKRGFISVDYERAWYNGIRLKSAPIGVNTYDYKVQATSYFQGSNTLRVGAEFKVTPAVAVRAGYGFNDGMLQSSSATTYSVDSPTVESVNYYSCGLGFVLSDYASLDVAYMYQNYSFSDYQLFSVDGGEVFSTDINTHNIAMTLALKF